MKLQSLLFTLILLGFTLGCQRDKLEPMAADIEAINVPLPADLPTYDAEALYQESLLDWQHDLAGLRAEGTVVELPAGSVDGLAAAIAAAGEGGTVIVKAGEHQESGMVTIDRKVKILGEPGAVLIVDTEPAQTTPTTATGIDPALYVFNAPGAMIWGLDIQPATAPGGTGILLENSPNTTVRNNRITGHQFSILLEKSDRSRIMNNTIVATGAWLTGELGEADGIVNINGDFVLVYNNDVSNALFGIWACDKGGYCVNNYTHENFLGIILCKVPDQAFPLPSGVIAGSEFPCNGWLTQNNISTGNFNYGILVIDGANGNFLLGNNLSNNGAYDLELTTDTYRFGFLTPEAYNNWAVVSSGNTVKNCGTNNKVYGGKKVDTGADPCN